MLESLKKFWEILSKNQKVTLLKLQFSVVLISLFDVVTITLVATYMSFVTDSSIVHNYINDLGLDFLAGYSDEKMLFGASAFIVIILTISSILSVYMTKVIFSSSYRLGSELSTKLFYFYQTRDWSYYLDKNTTVLTNNILVETNRLMNNVITPLNNFVSRAVFVLLISMAIVFYDVEVSLAIIFLFSVCYFVISRLTKERLKNNAKLIKITNAKRMKIAGESFGNLKTIQIERKESYFIELFDKYNSQSNSSQADNLVLSTSPRYIMEWLAFVSLILIISVNLIVRGQEFSQVLPVLTVFGLATFKLLPSLQQAYNALTIIKGNISVIDLLANDLMEANADEKNKLDEKTDIAFHCNINIVSASYTYPGKSNKALSNININISKNERIGIVGTSGAGKSTLIDVLTGLLELDSGDLNVDGVSVNKNRKSWSDNISYVPQVINLLDGTIAENIAFGCYKDDIDIDKINEVVGLANLNELVSSLPSGLDNDIGQNGVQLSGGQRQRLGIARALYTNANILIFDEATSALDGITEDKIMKAIDNISGIKTIILIAHRLNTVKKCDTIYIMDKGMIVDNGDYESLVSKNDFFRELSKLS